MNISKPRFFFWSLTLFSSFAISHEGGSSEQHINVNPKGFLGAVEIRPSLETDSGNVFAENVLELGYQLNNTFRIGYQQEIHHNIAIKEVNPEHEGLGLHLEEGFLNAHFHDLWESSNESSSLSLEPRLLLPTSSEERAKGFVTAALSYVKLRNEIGEDSSISIMDAPVFFAYSVPGAQLEEEFEANPRFQNRFRVSFDTSFFERKLGLSLPVLFYLTKHADYDSEAAHNDDWTTFVGIAPEITYAVASKLSIGFVLISPNLLNSQDTDHSVNHGRTSSVSQLVLRAQL